MATQGVCVSGASGWQCQAFVPCQQRAGSGRLHPRRAGHSQAIHLELHWREGFPVTGSVPWSGRSPGEGSGYPLQYSCLENPMDPRSLTGLQSMEWQRIRHDWEAETTVAALKVMLGTCVIKRLVRSFRTTEFSCGFPSNFCVPASGVFCNPVSGLGVLCSDGDVDSPSSHCGP